MRAIAIVSLIITGSVMTFAQSGSKQTFGANPNLPFSGAVKAGGLIYVAGSIGPASGELGKDIKTQTKQTLDNISATLTSAGSSMANVASMMVYLRSAGDFAAIEAHDLPILRVHLGDDVDAGLTALERAIDAALAMTQEA